MNYSKINTTVQIRFDHRVKRYEAISGIVKLPHGSTYDYAYIRITKLSFSRDAPTEGPDQMDYILTWSDGTQEPGQSVVSGSPQGIISKLTKGQPIPFLMELVPAS